MFVEPETSSAVQTVTCEQISTSPLSRLWGMQWQGIRSTAASDTGDPVNNLAYVLPANGVLRICDRRFAFVEPDHSAAGQVT